MRLTFVAGTGRGTINLRNQDAVIRDRGFYAGLYNANRQLLFDIQQTIQERADRDYEQHVRQNGEQGGEFRRERNTDARDVYLNLARNREYRYRVDMELVIARSLMNMPQGQQEAHYQDYFYGSRQARYRGDTITVMVRDVMAYTIRFTSRQNAQMNGSAFINMNGQWDIIRTRDLMVRIAERIREQQNIVVGDRNIASQDRTILGSYVWHVLREHNRNIPAKVLQVIVQREGHTEVGRNSGWSAFNTFSTDIKSVKYSDFAQRTPILYMQGLCLLETLVYIRDQYYGNDDDDDDDQEEQKMTHQQIRKRDPVMIRSEQIMQKIRGYGFDHHAIDTIVSGQILDSVHIFANKFIIYIGIYNSHTGQVYIPVDQISKYECVGTSTDESQDIIATYSMIPWWIVYEKMHVVPMKYPQLVQYVQARQKSAQYRQRINEKALVRQRIQLDDFKYMDWQQLQQDQEIVVMERNKLEERVGQMYQELSKKGKTMEDVYVYQCYKLESLPQKEIVLAEQKEKLKKRLDKHGLMAFDIETVIDNGRDSEFIGNARPICVCVYGYAYVDAMVKDQLILPEEGKTRVQRIDVDINFTGFDCIDQFVAWCTRMGLVQQQVQDKKATVAKASRKYLRDYKNYFVAHNGAKFDFRFLIDKFSKYSHISIVGTISKIKRIEFKNMIFTDSYLLVPMSLQNFCKTMQTKNKKFPYNITKITKSNWEQHLQEIIKYCRMDCLALYEAYYAYLLAHICEYYNNRAFPSLMYPITASQSAVDIFKTCYLKYDLKSYSASYEAEKQSYFGGPCCAFGTLVNNGISLDQNSGYPAAMHNLMPYEPIDYEDYVQGDEDIVCSQQSPLYVYGSIDLVDDLSLCQITFTFPDSTLYPSLSMRLDQTIVFPTSSNAERVWHWGVAINFAVQWQNARVMIHRKIQYSGARIFHDFVVDIYERRLVEKKRGNEAMQLQHKLTMNSSYGKFGQKINPQNKYGHLQELSEFIEEKEQFEKKDLKVLQLNKIFALNDKLYELKYTDGTESSTQIGSLVRFPSYITAVSKINLYRAIELVQMLCREIQQEPSAQEVKYIDTDSIFINMRKMFTHEQVQQLDSLYRQAEKYSNAYNEVLSLQNKLQKMDVLVSEGLQEDNKDEREKLQQKLRQVMSLLKDINLQQEEEEKMSDLSHQEDNDNDWLKKVALGQIYKEKIIQPLMKIYDTCPLIKRLAECKVLDPRYMVQTKFLVGNEQNIEQHVPLLDGTTCGAYKIEKYIHQSLHLGAKTYGGQVFDLDVGGLVKNLKKMKGIHNDRIVFDHYQEIFQELNMQDFYGPIESTMQKWQQMYDQQKPSNYVHRYSQIQFSVLHTGVRIGPIVKYTTHTLSKRVYTDAKGEFSRPFRDTIEQKAIQKKIQDMNSYLKSMYDVADLTPIINQKDGDGDEQQNAVAALINQLINEGDIVSREKDLALYRQLYSEEKERVRDEQEQHQILFQMPAEAICDMQVYNKIQLFSQLYRLVNEINYRLVEFVTQIKDHLQNSWQQVLETILKKIVLLSSAQLKIEDRREMNRTLVQAQLIYDICEKVLLHKSQVNPYAQVVQYLSHFILGKADTAFRGRCQRLYMNKRMVEIIDEDFQQVIEIVAQVAGPAQAQFMCEQLDFIVYEDTQLKQSKQQMRTMMIMGNLSDRELVKERIRKQLHKASLYLERKSKIKVTAENEKYLLTVYANLRHLTNTQENSDTMQQIRSVYESTFHRTRSRIKAMLVCVRDYILMDQQAFYGRWDKIGDYSRMSKYVRQMLEKMATQFLETALQQESYAEMSQQQYINDSQDGLDALIAQLMEECEQQDSMQ